VSIAIASTMIYRFPDAIEGQGEHKEIGVFPFSQVQEMYPHLGVMCALHYQLLKSNEAKNWQRIGSYIHPIVGTCYTFQLQHATVLN
jgi:hypothetical protein